MPARAFEARGTENDPDPITFTVSGREFRCVPMAPLAALDIIAELPAIPDRADPGYIAAVTAWCTRAALFVSGCLTPDTRPGWESLTRTEYLEPDLYAELVTWLADTYRDRITVTDTAPAAPSPVEGHSGANPGDMDPITARQYELDAAAGITHDAPSDLPPHLQALLDAGGGFTLPTT